MAPNSLFCADVPLRNYSLTNPPPSTGATNTAARPSDAGRHSRHSRSLWGGWTHRWYFSRETNKYSRPTGDIWRSRSWADTVRVVAADWQISLSTCSSLGGKDSHHWHVHSYARSSAVAERPRDLTEYFAKPERSLKVIGNSTDRSHTSSFHSNCGYILYHFWK